MKSKIIEKIKNSKNIVILTGAGVSTHSGLKDYRSENGIYADNPEYMLSYECLHNEHDKFIEFIRKHFDFKDALPNDIHKWIASLEKDNKKVTVVTQNIDGLHQKAGSSNVLEIHGNIDNWICCSEDCNESYNLNYAINNSRCSCNNDIRPEVILYGENLDDNKFNQACLDIANSDLIIVIGTSLSVFPFASIIEASHPLAYCMLINKEDTLNYSNIFNMKYIGDAMDLVSELNKIEA